MEQEEEFVDPLTQQRIERGWNCILDQYFEKVRKDNTNHGPGVSIFRFLRTKRNDGSNCQYSYSELNGEIWNNIFKASPYSEKILEKYDPVETLVICVQVPLGNYGDDYTGCLKIFKKDKKEEIPIFENCSSDENTETANENLGLHKRKGFSKTD